MSFRRGLFPGGIFPRYKPEVFTQRLATQLRQLHLTNCAAVVKCSNTTGFKNLRDPRYPAGGIDMFMAGASVPSKQPTRQLALDAGFATCHDLGSAAQFELLEQLALSWINLAIRQAQGRSIALTTLRR